MPAIYNALDLVKGKKVQNNKFGTLIQPLQFLPQAEKDDQWAAMNMDWYEWQGLRQIRRNAGKLLKWYKLAEGEIDRSDYIVDDDNEMKDIIDYLKKEDQSALQLKFYPLAPTIIKVFQAEFSKRASKLQFRAVDDQSTSEMEKEKEEMIEQYLLQDAEQRMVQEMIQMGMDPDSPQAQQQLDPQNLKSLPEIQDYFQKSYRNRIEEWSMHQHKVDYQRFHMNELEERAFKDMLVTDREFWHFRMMEDDYELELWNPLQTFYRKSPDARYISQSSYVGMIDMMSVADVLDKYGWMMTDEQARSLEQFYPVRAAGYLIDGMQNDGSYYNPALSHKENVEGPSLAYRQFLNRYYNSPQGGDVIYQILNESEDLQDFNNTNLVRVTTTYWKSQRMLYHLTEITEDGKTIQDTVDENFKVTNKPVYNTTVYKNKTKDNLVFGQHLDRIWINETWGGIKIGPHSPSYWGMNNPAGFAPIYLGMKGGKPGRVPFQFKGDNSLYGCKLPVEGAVFTDRNVKSLSLVGSIYPYQVLYNLVNNQIADILIDENGTVILLDQNSLPKQSLGEDWGKNRYANAYMAMKNFGILPLDTTLGNTEQALNFQHYQPLDLSQTQRLLGRVNLANYFKQQTLETIGFNPTRMGQPLGKQDTATGIENDLNASYAQTEIYYIRHCDYLMPRVHQMRTELAQYYNSTNPSVRLQYTTALDEQITFRIDGTKLLPRDINVFASTTVNARSIMEELKQLILNNNTMGATIYDLGNVLKAESLAEVDKIMKSIEVKADQQKQAEMQQEKQMHDEQLAQEEALKREEWDRMDRRQELNNQKDVLVAEIRAAGMGSMVDLNNNGENDYEDALNRIERQQQFQDTMNFKREQDANKTSVARENQNIQRDKISAENKRSTTDLQVARIEKSKKAIDAKKRKQ